MPRDERGPVIGRIGESDLIGLNEMLSVVIGLPAGDDEAAARLAGMYF